MTELSEDHVESLRRDIGEKMARDKEGTPIEGASASLKSGYRRGALGFGSNTQPRKFGKGGDVRTDWTCVCGQENRRYLTRCGMCNLHFSTAREANS